jgi:hypothetical protein
MGCSAGSLKLQFDGQDRVFLFPKVTEVSCLALSCLVLNFYLLDILLECFKRSCVVFELGSIRLGACFAQLLNLHAVVLKPPINRVMQVTYTLLQGSQLSFETANFAAADSESICNKSM